MNERERTERRSLLAAGAAALIAPPWLAHAFAAQEPGHQPSPTPGPSALEGALLRARERGKPLMAVLVPIPALRQVRGRLWGDLFAFASDEALADFVLCEWACIGEADLKGKFPELPLTNETIAVLIETDSEAARPRRVALEMGDLAPKENTSVRDSVLRARVENVAARLRPAILPDDEALARRAKQSRKTLGLGNVSMPDFAPASGRRPRLREYDAWAAPLRMLVAKEPGPRAELTKLLAQACALRLWENDPAGARWSVEHADPCPPCGMAMINATGRAFLEFYTHLGPR